MYLIFKTYVIFYYTSPRTVYIDQKSVDIYISQVNKWCNRMYEVLLSSHDIKLEHLILLAKWLSKLTSQYKIV